MPEVVSWRAFAPSYLAGFSIVSIWIDLSPELWLHGPTMAAKARFTFWLFAFALAFGKVCELWPLLSLSEFLDLLISAHPVRPKLQNEAARCGYQRFSIGWPKTPALGPPPCYSAANGRNRERRPIAETPRPPDDGGAVPSRAPSGAPLGAKTVVGLPTLKAARGS